MMDWVTTTAKTLDEARSQALDVLGVAEDEAEIEIVQEPRTGLFGRVRGEAKIRARVRPTQARPRVGGRRGGRQKQHEPDAEASTTSAAAAPAAVSRHAEAAAPADAVDDDQTERDAAGNDADAGAEEGSTNRSTRSSGGSDGRRPRRGDARGQATRTKERAMSDNDTTTDGTPDGVTAPRPSRDVNHRSGDDGVSVEDVKAAAVGFMEGLLDAFGLEGCTVDATSNDNEIDVQVSGENLGILVGPAGRTLLAIQDVLRVAAQRRLGDHETRLRLDVGGYREKRREALERFAHKVADDVVASGEAQSLEPMPSADRKILHDALTAHGGVRSVSEGDDPNRRVVVHPA